LFTCHDFMVKVKNFKSRTNAGIVIDGESIFDIRVINVFPHKILIAVD
jgi:putative heme iron utilization protein